MLLHSAQEDDPGRQDVQNREIQLRVIKNRHGERGSIDLEFDGAWSRFEEKGGVGR